MYICLVKEVVLFWMACVCVCVCLFCTCGGDLYCSLAEHCTHKGAFSDFRFHTHVRANTHNVRFGGEAGGSGSPVSEGVEGWDCGRSE